MRPRNFYWDLDVREKTFITFELIDPLLLLSLYKIFGLGIGVSSPIIKVLTVRVSETMLFDVNIWS